MVLKESLRTRTRTRTRINITGPQTWVKMASKHYITLSYAQVDSGAGSNFKGMDTKCWREAINQLATANQPTIQPTNK